MFTWGAWGSLTAMNSDATVSESGVAARLPIAPWMRAVAWGILSVFGLIGSVLALAWPAGHLESWFGLPHAAVLGLWAFASTLAAGALAYYAARATLGVWPMVRTGAAGVLVAGAVVAGAHVWLLMDWGVAAFDSFDPEYLGSAGFLWAIVAGVAVAGFGVQVGPVGARWPAVLGVAFGVFNALGIGLTYLPRLLDGIAPSTVLPALASVAAVSYIGVVAVASVWRLLRPASQ